MRLSESERERAIEVAERRVKRAQEELYLAQADLEWVRKGYAPLATAAEPPLQEGEAVVTESVIVTERLEVENPSVRKRGGKFEVVSADGRVLGRHASKAKADRQVRAISVHRDERSNPGLAPSYEGTHWGIKPKGTKTLDAPDPRKGPLTELGELVSVTYGTIKAGDAAITDYTHTFNKRRPTLAYNREGRLLILGGDYKLEKRGIVG